MAADECKFVTKGALISSIEVFFVFVKQIRFFIRFCRFYCRMSYAECKINLMDR